MADTKISALSAISAVADVDLFPVVDDPAGTPVTKKATLEQLRNQILVLPTTTGSTVGVIYKDATAFFHNFNPPNTDGGNIFMGGAGNFTMAWDGVNSYTAARNVGIGPDALQSLTTGFFNYGIGWRALNANTTGAGNVALGGNANPVNTVGWDNIAIGDDALLANVDSSVNTAIGHYAGQGLISSGTPTNKTSGRNIFIGYGADVHASVASTLTGSIAIGDGSIVTASNQMVLGGTVTETKIGGNVTLTGINATLNVPGLINANAVGAQIRMKADGTGAKDAFLGANSSGVIYLSNWDLTRGWQINANGSVRSIGTHAVGIGGDAGTENLLVTGTFRATGTITAGVQGSNIRVTADGTTSLDGGILTTIGGDVYFSNWDLTRGWKVQADGVILDIGSGVKTPKLTATSATGGIGYGTGAGGTVTQDTSRTTGVTLNKVTGAITLVSAVGSATPATFTVTNSTVAATDTIKVSQKSGTDIYHVLVSAVAAGSFNLTVFTTGGTTTEQPVFNFAVLKAVAA